ncbi:MAG: Fic family protein [Gemmataceae bacterium]
MRFPKRPPAWRPLFDKILHENPDAFAQAANPATRDLIEKANAESWNWEDSSYRAHQSGLSPKEFWVFVKLARSIDRQSVPLDDAQGRPFSFRLPRSTARLLREIDLHLGGVVAVAESFPVLADAESKRRYLITSLTEEAIASSQIEGAAVTREVAKEMLRTDRPPRSQGERMILNNYRTIRFLNERRGEPMTPELLCDIQRRLTEDTLDDPSAAGRFRRADELIQVFDGEENEPVFTPPPAGELTRRIDLLCEFANAPPDGGAGGDYIHPAVRAIILHFWLAFTHPFKDGNGRTARALFYWSMLRSRYWLTEYLAISTIIRNHPKQYGRAFLNTEVDDNDLSYFILYHLHVIERSIAEFRAYLDRKKAERERLAAVLRSADFDPRQLDILGRALRDPTTRFTYESHANSQGVAINTAKKDLLDLESRGLLIGNRRAKRFEFVAAADLDRRLRKLAGRRNR